MTCLCLWFRPAQFCRERKDLWQFGAFQIVTEDKVTQQQYQHLNSQSCDKETLHHRSAWAARPALTGRPTRGRWGRRTWASWSRTRGCRRPRSGPATGSSSGSIRTGWWTARPSGWWWRTATPPPTSGTLRRICSECTMTMRYRVATF